MVAWLTNNRFEQLCYRVYFKIGDDTVVKLMTLLVHEAIFFAANNWEVFSSVLFQMLLWSYIAAKIILLFNLPLVRGSTVQI